MPWFILLLVLVVLLYGKSPPNPTQKTQPTLERPTVNLPVDLRQSNWGSGSCVHAVIVSLFRWQGHFEMADYWRKTYTGGEYPSTAAKKLDKEGIRYAYTSGENDVSFLEWSVRTRRGCGVTVRDGKHFVTLVELTESQACLMDNNKIDNYKWVPRDQFLAEWKASGSWALAILYTPAAPLP